MPPAIGYNGRKHPNRERAATGLQFTKMHGLGNDFIILNCFRQPIDAPDALARKLCDRHFGVGADGLILALPSSVADARMRIFNADGSEPEMCGNGIRCLGKFLYDGGLCRKPKLAIETLAGVLTLEVRGQDGVCEAVTVDMGAPVFDPKAIPVAADSNDLELEVDGRKLRFFCVSMGNPHAVTFDLYPPEADFRRLGALLERHGAFPRRANIEFCRLNASGGADVQVWERGAGPTLACGTGACAVLAAGVRLGLLPRRAGITLPGGTLDILWDDDGHLHMTGPATTVFDGSYKVQS